MLTALIKNLCHCKEVLKINEPIIHGHNDRREDYEANHFLIIANKGRVILQDQCPVFWQYDIELRFYTDQPQDCTYIGQGAKGRLEMAGNAIEEMTKRVFDLIFCLADKSNPYAKGYRDRLTDEKAYFHFPNTLRQMEWKTATDQIGSTQNKEWYISTSFKINADYDYCQKCTAASPVTGGM